MLRKQFKLYLFDLDGTLLDSAPNLANHARWVLAQHQIKSPDFSALKSKAGHGAAAMLSLANSEHLSAFYLQTYQENSFWFPEALPIIQKIKNMGASWGIVTNKPRKFVLQALQNFPIAPDVVVCGDDLALKKPHPAPLLKACENFKISETVFIGDDLNDAQAATAIEMDFVFAAYGYGQVQNINVLKINNLGELL